MNVYYDGTLVGKSPCTVAMSKKDLTQGKRITIVSDGIKVNQTFLNRKINVGILAVDLLGGIIPAFIDLATGALYSPSPPYHKLPINQGRQIILNNLY